MATPYDSRISPFSIQISAAQLEDLTIRLRQTRWPTALPGVDWQRGVALDYIQHVADSWQHNYDWPAQQEALNRLPQFMTVINHQPIHFVHVRAERSAALGLVLLHGWPGGFQDFVDVLAPLTHQTSRLPFDLIIPTLPGFGYSTPLAGPGMNNQKIAELLVELMARLDYDRYGVHGYDLGSWVGTEMAKLAPQRLVGLHLNSALSFPIGQAGETDDLSDLDAQRWEQLQAFDDAYFHVNSKRPQTIAYALTDSPVGQLAWLLDLYKDMTYSAEVLPDAVISLETILTNVSLFWFTASAASAAQLYFEETQHSSFTAEQHTVPTAVLVSAMDITVRQWAERDHSIIRWTELHDGGHFLAHERPDALVADLQEFFAALV